MMPADSVEMLLRLCCAMVVGGVVGWNRHRAGKPAGIGTHALVALGAGLFVAIPASGGEPHLEALSRAIQGVAAGVGFLGAGEIFRDPGSGEQVTGLTSAAALWVTGALGLTIVSGPSARSGARHGARPARARARAPHRASVPLPLQEVAAAVTAVTGTA